MARDLGNVFFFLLKGKKRITMFKTDQLLYRRPIIWGNSQDGHGEDVN